MKRVLLATVALIAIIAVNACCNQASQEVTSECVVAEPTDYTQEDYEAIQRSQHPRLLSNNEDFAKMKHKATVEAEQNPVLAKMYGTVLKQADKYLSDGVEVKYQLDESNYRLLHQSRAALERLATWSFAYRATSDERYLTAARRLMTKVCKFPDWNQQQHYLDVGEMAMAVAFTYDWLYEQLTPAERKMAEESLCKNAITTYQGQWFRRSIHNWNQVCYAGLVYSAIAIMDKYPDPAMNTIDDAVLGNVRAMEAGYSPDGNYSEGYGYWDYGTGFELAMLSALKYSFGHTRNLTSIDGFDKTGDYILNMIGPTGKGFNYYDNSEGRRGRVCPYMWQLASMLDKPSILYQEYMYMQEGFYDNAYDRLYPVIVTSLKDIDVSKITKPQYQVYHGEGITPLVIVHGDWSLTESDTYLGIKAGTASSNHAHMDAGSFVYETMGERWASDLGAENYAPTEVKFKKRNWDLWSRKDESARWNVFRISNFAHNVISVNDQIYRASGVSQILEVIDRPNEKGAVIDVTEPLDKELKSAKRTIKLVNNSELVIIDEITALDNKDAKIDWRMATNATPQIVDNAIELTLNGKKLYLKGKTSSEVKPELKTWSGNSGNDWDSDNKGITYVGHTTTLPAGKSFTITTTLTNVL